MVLVGAEHLPQLLVPTLADQVQVDVAERRQEAVRLVDDVPNPVVVDDLDAVIGNGRALPRAAPHAAALVHQRNARGADEHGDLARVWPEAAEGDDAVAQVRAENLVRIVMRAGDQPIDIRRRCGHRSGRRR